MTEADMSEEKFQLGIIFFLLSHTAYIIAFLEKYQFQRHHTGIAIAILMVLAFLYKNFRDGLKDTILKIGVPVYMLVLSAMMFMALGNINGSYEKAGILIAAGASMFWISDIIIGVNSFWKKVPRYLCFVWLLYAPGQLLIALSVIYH